METIDASLLVIRSGFPRNPVDVALSGRGVSAPLLPPGASFEISRTIPVPGSGWAYYIAVSAGKAYVTPATLDGRWMVRVSIGAEPTEREDVEALWELMQQEAGGMATGTRR